MIVFTVKTRRLILLEYHPVGGEAHVEHYIVGPDYAVIPDQVEARIALQTQDIVLQSYWLMRLENCRINR